MKGTVLTLLIALVWLVPDADAQSYEKWYNLVVTERAVANVRTLDDLQEDVANACRAFRPEELRARVPAVLSDIQRQAVEAFTALPPCPPPVAAGPTVRQPQPGDWTDPVTPPPIPNEISPLIGEPRCRSWIPVAVHFCEGRTARGVLATGVLAVGLAYGVDALRHPNKEVVYCRAAVSPTDPCPPSEVERVEQSRRWTTVGVSAGGLALGLSLGIKW